MLDSKGRFASGPLTTDVTSDLVIDCNCGNRIIIRPEQKTAKCFKCLRRFGKYPAEPLKEKDYPLSGELKSKQVRPYRSYIISGSKKYYVEDPEDNEVSQSRSLLHTL